MNCSALMMSLWKTSLKPPLAACPSSVLADKLSHLFISTFKVQSVLPVSIAFLLWVYLVHRGISCQESFELSFGAWERRNKAGSNIGQWRNRRGLLSMCGLTEEGMPLYRLCSHCPESDGLKLERICPPHRTVAGYARLTRCFLLKYSILIS